MADVQQHQALTSAVANESRALYAALISAGVSGIAAFVYFLGRQVPLSGAGSVGMATASAAAILSFATFCVAYTLSFQDPSRAWMLRVSRARRVFDVAALAFVHAAIAFLTMLASFYVFQDAFQGLVLEPFAAAMFVAACCGVTAYSVYLSGSSISSYTLANLLAVFIVAGAFTSMITTDNTQWWQTNFSILGASDSGNAAYAFNVTLILSGAVITVLASYITSDLRTWRKLKGHQNMRGVELVQWLLVILGICLSLVGLVPVDVSVPAHNTAAMSMMLIFAAITLGLPFWIKEIPKTFFGTSYTLLGVLLLAVVLYFPLGYYNLTALELAAGAIIFGWLVIFIRTVAAMVADAQSLETLQQETVAEEGSSATESSSGSQ